MTQLNDLGDMGCVVVRGHCMQGLVDVVGQGYDWVTSAPRSYDLWDKSETFSHNIRDWAMHLDVQEKS